MFWPLVHRLMVFLVRDLFSSANFDQTWRVLLHLQSKKEGKDQESIQSSTTPDPGYQCKSNNYTIRHHKREPRGQSFPSRTTRHQ